MISHLVYASKRGINCSVEEIEKILLSSTQNNLLLDITGCLLYTDYKFIQYLEGDFYEIKNLFEKLKLDSRHENLVLIAMGSSKNRLFPNWQMGCKPISNDEVMFNSNITEAEKNIYNSIINGKEEKSKKIFGIIQKLFYSKV